MDGVRPINNVIIFGTTNRLDLIDPALLRPGRFEIHLQVGLPNREGRLEILKIYMDKLSRVIDEKVSMDELADATHNRTGAELEAIVSTAAKIALREQIDLGNLEKAQEIKQVCIKSNHFQQAIGYLPPAFGCSDVIRKLSSPSLTPELSDEYSSFASVLEKRIIAFLAEPLQTKFLINLIGCHGSGKTFLACQLIKKCFGDDVLARYISPADLSHLGEMERNSRIHDTFSDLSRAAVSAAIIDDMDILVSPLPHQYYRETVTTLKSLFAKNWLYGKLVVITCSSSNDLEETGLLQRFNDNLTIPPIH